MMDDKVLYSRATAQDIIGVIQSQGQINVQCRINKEVRIEVAAPQLERVEQENPFIEMYSTWFGVRPAKEQSQSHNLTEPACQTRPQRVMVSVNVGIPQKKAERCIITSES